MSSPSPEVRVSVSGLGLRLREWTDEDLPVMVDLFDDPEVARWTPLCSPFDLAAARSYLDRARSRRAQGRGLQLAITAGGDLALGEVLLAAADPTGRDPEGGTVELAYAVGPAHRGRGLGTRAVRLMTAYAYRRLGMRQVVLRIAADNVASAAVARAAGFVLAADADASVSANAEPDERPLLTWRHRGADGSVPFSS